MLDVPMASPLPPLRDDLDVMPSPLPEQPGLLVRDPFHYSDVTLVIPPLLARCLGCFDGEHDEGDLRAAISRLAGQVEVGDAAKRLIAALDEAGFLDNARFAPSRDFNSLSERPPVKLSTRSNCARPSSGKYSMRSPFCRRSSVTGVSRS